MIILVDWIKPGSNKMSKSYIDTVYYFLSHKFFPFFSALWDIKKKKKKPKQRPTSTV